MFSSVVHPCSTGVHIKRWVTAKSVLDAVYCLADALPSVEANKRRRNVSRRSVNVVSDDVVGAIRSPKYAEPIDGRHGMECDANTAYCQRKLLFPAVLLHRWRPSASLDCHAYPVA